MFAMGAGGDKIMGPVLLVPGRGGGQFMLGA